MNFINFNNQSNTDFTLISNTFICEHMPTANATFVKVYIYMLMLNEQNIQVSMEEIANTLDVLESDVVIALKFWHKAGVLKFTKANNGYSLSFIKDIETIDTEDSMYENDDLTTSKTGYKNLSASYQEANTKNYSSEETLYIIKKNPDIQNLMSFIENLYGSSFTPTNVQNLISLFDDETNKLDGETLKLLVTYIFHNKNVKKIVSLLKNVKTFASTLSEQNITGYDEVKTYLDQLNKNTNHDLILKRFGITEREATLSEVSFMDKWLHEYKLSLDSIYEACDKTMTTIHESSFPYADGILKNTMKKTQDTRPCSTIKSAAKIKNKFANFGQESLEYDNVDHLEKEYFLKKYGR